MIGQLLFINYAVLCTKDVHTVRDQFAIELGNLKDKSRKIVLTGDLVADYNVRFYEVTTV